MFPITCFKGRKVAVFGLARSGIASARALNAGGADTACWDDNETARSAAADTGLTLEDLTRSDFVAFDALVLSPGVPLTHPVPHWTVEKAHAAGVEIIGDTELLMRERDARGAKSKLIAITGTNGKSTTTALIAHVLQSAGIGTVVGGNIGTPVLDLDAVPDDGAFVLEFSSYQIDLTPGLHADVAVLLNLSPDHLDRHGDMERYAAVKERIFANQTAADTAVIGVDDDHVAAIAGRCLKRDAKAVPISSLQTLDEGVYVADGVIYEAAGGSAARIADIADVVSLKGVHNWQNAAAAVAAARALGLCAGEIERGLRSFPGLAHRMEPVARLGDVLFVNDSKATNAEAAARALACFEHIFWIAGGRAKSGGIDSLNNFFPKIDKAYLIGEAADDFAATLAGHTEVIRSGTLERAVAEAAVDAVAAAGTGEIVVLLSPACASFDQFADFELRGEAFRAAVARIGGIEMIGRDKS